jgi:glycosyltransferase involved in cell wall biosynthesis
MPKVKILMIIPTLGSGGAERVMVNLLNHLDREKFEPTLYLEQIEGEYLSALKDDIEVVSAGERRGVIRLLFLRGLIRRLRPQIVFIMMLSAAVISARLARIGAKTVIRETESRPPEQVRQNGLIRWLNRTGIRAADCYIAPAEAAKRYLVDRYRLLPEDIHVINNPVDIAKIQNLAQAPQDFDSEEFNLLSVGRLTHQKGYDLLIEGLARIQEIPWRLRILGKGKDEPMLRRLAADRGISGRVEFLGLQTNPYSFMASSDLLVLSSRWEGLPNVVLEGMASGVPVLATRCPTGPEEIITPGLDGELCEIDSASLAAAIEKLFADRENLEKLSAAAAARIRHFDLPKIIKQYEKYFLGQCEAG